MNFTKLISGLTLLIAFSACSKKDDTTPQSDSKEITLFTIDTAKGVIDPATHTITVNMPASTDVTKLSPAITVADKATVSPASGTPQDFTHPVTYTVKAQNGTTQTYTVTVAKASAAAILSFSFKAKDSVLYTGVFDSTNKHLVKIGMGDYVKASLTSIKPIITVSAGATISPASEAAVDLTKPVTYTVTSAKGEVAEYTVQVMNNDNSFFFSVAFQKNTSFTARSGIIVDVAKKGVYPEDVFGLTGIAGLVEVLETEDISNLVLNDVMIPTGMTISPDPSLPQNFDKDVKYVLKNEFGITSTFTIRMFKRKSIVVADEVFQYEPQSGENVATLRYWAEAPLAKVWVVDVVTKQVYDCTTENYEALGLYFNWVYPVAATPTGKYFFMVKMPDGTIINTRTQVNYTKS